MTWVDGLLLFLVAVVTYAGMRRGIVLELFDCIIFLIACTVAFATYRWLASLLGFIPATSNTRCGLAFTLMLAASGTPLAFLAQIIDREYSHQIVKAVREVGGLMIGFFKSWVLAWMFLLLIASLPLNGGFRGALRGAPVVGATQGTVTPLVYTLLDTLTTPKVARRQKIHIRHLQF